jgi:hypothetical protein
MENSDVEMVESSNSNETQPSFKKESSTLDGKLSEIETLYNYLVELVLKLN